LAQWLSAIMVVLFVVGAALFNLALVAALASGLVYWWRREPMPRRSVAWLTNWAGLAFLLVLLPISTMAIVHGIREVLKWLAP
jgi:hypothetical protein